jgi:predicted nucleic acid-binding protein
MPETPRIVISNATPIIGLTLIRQLHLLQRLYVEVLIPPAVYAEVLAGGTGRPGFAELQRAPWIRMTPLQDPRRADLLSDLDRGEAEVLALAQELDADLVIVDERLGRRHAKRLGLTLTGTLGVLLRAKAQGYLAEVKPWIDQLQQGGIRLDAFVVKEALQLAEE